jgi:hypothetical protein
MMLHSGVFNDKRRTAQKSLANELNEPGSKIHVVAGIRRHYHHGDPPPFVMHLPEPAQYPGEAIMFVCNFCCSINFG